MLDVIYDDEDLVAINKPHGLLVHRSRIAMDATEFAVQMLRDQIGKKVYPVHRLDRKTAGLLLFATSREVNAEISTLFQNNEISKTYHAIVRGWTDEEGSIDYALTNEGKTKEAKTDYKLLKKFELEWAHGRFQTSRYSLLEIKPLTGRFHQIRKHLKHIYHPILGDRPHGCNKQNRLWKEKVGLNTMMLQAVNLNFTRKNGQVLNLIAPRSVEIIRTLEILSKSR